MRIVQPYKQLNRLIKNETFEPDISWGIRMAIAAMAPLIWGLYANRLEDAGWIALIAECICWVELKGDFQHRLKLLAGSSAMAMLFALLGSVTGQFVWLSIIMMAVVAFISSLLKNIGNRGSGIAICVYALFIFCNAYPTTTIPELNERTGLLLVGVLWNAIAAIVASAFVKANKPYRRSIAVIWKAIAGLSETVAKGWDGVSPRSNDHDIYLKEKEIRTAIDGSLDFFEKLAHEASEKDGHEYVLAQVRKAAALVGVQVQAISEELETIDRKQLDTALRIKVFTLIRALEQTLDRMAVFTITSERGEELILRSRISRLYKLTSLLRERLESETFAGQEKLLRFVQLAERATRIIESSFNNLQTVVKERSMVRSYSMMKTVFILHPKYWVRYVRILFDFGTFTARYALRSALAAGFAMFLYKFWSIDHGYWIPFTLIIVMQTYFGATWVKARDRIIGTVTGGIVAGLFLRIPTGLYIQEALLFLSFIPMIYYLRRRYSVAAFFITINLVLLFNINRELDNMLIFTRAMSTIAGAGIAVVSGFLLMPMWDKKWLPVHIADAIHKNYTYFLSVFHPDETNAAWTTYKRKTESANSNAFDSFNRYMDEPSFRKKPFAIFYYIITHNIRITRELNNIQLESDDEVIEADSETLERQAALIDNCLECFNANVALLRHLDKEGDYTDMYQQNFKTGSFVLTHQQEVYLEKLQVELKAMHNDLEILREKLPRIMQL